MHDPPVIDPVTVHMQQCRLRQACHRLVHALDDNIGAEAVAVFRKIRMHAQMRPVCFINDQDRPVFMRDLRNPPHITHDTFIGRARDHDCADRIAMILKRTCDPLRQRLPIKFPLHLRQRCQRLFLFCTLAVGRNPGEFSEF